MFTKILGYKVFNGSKDELMEFIEGLEQVNIVSGNPQVLYSGLKNKFLFESFNDDKSIIIPDGIGTVICSKIVKEPVEEKIAGIEVMNEIIRKCAEEGKGIYLVGAKQEILNECIINLKTKYVDLNILGSHDGFFDLDDCEDIVSDIEKKQPYAVFVAMGCPRQEIFIDKYLERFKCRFIMGVGGSFDVIAGKVKRAPKWMINLGMEWLYRVIKEPFRIKRLAAIPKFIFRVVISNEKN